MKRHLMQPHVDSLIHTSAHRAGARYSLCVVVKARPPYNITHFRDDPRAHDVLMRESSSFDCNKNFRLLTSLLLYEPDFRDNN